MDEQQTAGLARLRRELDRDLNDPGYRDIAELILLGDLEDMQLLGGFDAYHLLTYVQLARERGLLTAEEAASYLRGGPAAAVAIHEAISRLERAKGVPPPAPPVSGDPTSLCVKDGW